MTLMGGTAWPRAVPRLAIFPLTAGLGADLAPLIPAGSPPGLPHPPAWSSLSVCGIVSCSSVLLIILACRDLPLNF